MTDAQTLDAIAQVLNASYTPSYQELEDIRNLLRGSGRAILDHNTGITYKYFHPRA